jgi:hypothetical protein
MFLSNSRYASTPTEQTTTPDGRTVTSVVLRHPAPASGDGYTVKDNDRLDLIANERLSDDTAFWRVADANTALQAKDLVASAGDVILVPKPGS